MEQFMNFGLIQYLLSVAGGFLIIYTSIPVLLKIAYLKDLYDKPDEERKLHKKFIPALGGVGIFIAFFLGFTFSGLAESITGFSFISGSLIALFFCGLKDDLVGLSPNKKLFVEIISALAIILGSGLIINDLHGVLGLNEIPLYISIPLSLFTVIVVVNSYNLIDGVDGLAGGIGLIASAFFGIVFLMAQEFAMAGLAGMLTVVLAGYLRYNFNPARIFMGDTGSLVIGFLLAVMTMHLIPLNDSPVFQQYFGISSPILPVAFLALPLYDTLRVFAKRLLNGKSPFTPGSDHIHHVLLKLGWGQKTTVGYLYVVSVVIGLIGLSSSFLNPNIALGFVILSTFIFYPTFGLKRKLFSKLGLDIPSVLSTEENKELYAHLDTELRILKKRKKEKSSI